ncbi:MAG TPA: hypothetical protein VG733_09630 [Chthoniobacteraceae bacterium]|nr:hypothetical protein [Chthoniobacteraceae bacterium]
MNTPIGERIWKREEARDGQAALMIAITLRHGDQLQRQFEPFIAATKQWWRASHGAKERDFLITVADEATRPPANRLDKTARRAAQCDRLFKHV